MTTVWYAVVSGIINFLPLISQLRLNCEFSSSFFFFFFLIDDISTLLFFCVHIGCNLIFLTTGYYSVSAIIYPVSPLPSLTVLTNTIHFFFSKIGCLVEHAT